MRGLGLQEFWLLLMPQLIIEIELIQRYVICLIKTGERWVVQVLYLLILSRSGFLFWKRGKIPMRICWHLLILGRRMLMRCRMDYMFTFLLLTLLRFRRELERRDLKRFLVNW